MGLFHLCHERFAQISCIFRPVLKAAAGIFGLFFLLIRVNGQLTPVAPSMYSVSVDPETGYDVITWYPSPSATVDYHTVGVVFIPNPTEPYVIVPLTDVYPPDTSFININTDSDLHPIGYAVCAVNDQGVFSSYRSLYTVPDSTIHLTADFDSCKATLSLSWNPYRRWQGAIASYDIYRRLGPGIYNLIESVNGNSTASVLNNIQVNQLYDLFVEAVHQDGERLSKSNRVQITTIMAQLPGYVNGDFATIGPDNTINLSFTVDGNSDYSKYRLMRSTSITGPYQQIDSIITYNSKITYTDPVNFRSSVYYYRLDVVNNCEISVLQSNAVNNIVLSASLSGGLAELNWNSYSDWLGGVENYTIVRSMGRDVVQIDTLDAGLSNFYVEDIASMANYANPVSSQICYTIEANEVTNLLGIKGKSSSNRVCLPVLPDVHMPNAFIPNDPDPMLSKFEPVFSFLPERYDLVIYNRAGIKVYEGHEGWDGRSAGNTVPEGVYLYYLRLYTQVSEKVEYNGSVTVVYR